MKISSLAISLILLFSLVSSLRQKRCLALSMEGGGTKGAFQAGAFRAMVEYMNPEEVKYDVIAGVSVGAMNGLGIAATEKGNEKKASAYLTQMWKTIKQENIFVQWPYIGFLQGLFWKPSFFDNSPQLGYLTKVFESAGGKIKRKMSISIVDANSMEYIVYDESVGDKKIPYYVVASTSVPGFFPYIADGSKVFIDGGSTDNLNIDGAIFKCRELVDDDSQITIDIIMTNPINAHRYNMTKLKSYDIYKRGKELAVQLKDFWYLNNTLRDFPRVNWRYIIAPKEKLPNYPGIALSFDRETLDKEDEIGYNDAKEVVKGKANIRSTLEIDEFPKLSPLPRRIQLK